MGAWIEILQNWERYNSMSVAPLVGAWIEIGLSAPVVLVTIVAPLVGAWIEIHIPGMFLYFRLCRSPRGSVD